MFKTVIVLTGLLAINLAFADEKADREQAKFDKRQTIVVERLTQKISGLEAYKSCAEQATDKAGLKDCRAQAKEANQARKQEAKAERAERKAQKKAERDARKAERAAKKASKNQ